MDTYKRLTPLEREKISILLRLRLSFGDIGNILNRSKSTIYREVKRNAVHRISYTAHAAHKFTDYRARKKKLGKRKLILNPDLLEYVRSKLKLRWSPEQISVQIKKDHPNNPEMRISHEAIYTYIYILPRGGLRKELTAALRQENKTRQKRQGRNTKRGRIQDMISIEERPKEVEDRTIPGHWEGDLLVGPKHKSFLGTIVERTTRTVIMVPLKSKNATEVRKAFARELKKLPQQMRQSMTYDNGSEMSEHKLFTKDTKMQVYFAHPYSPWERGTNENTNMLIRDFFKKNTDFNKVSRYHIKKVQRLLNERPRKTLNWITPKEAFANLLDSS